MFFFLTGYLGYYVVEWKNVYMKSVGTFTQTFTRTNKTPVPHFQFFAGGSIPACGAYSYGI